MPSLSRPSRLVLMCCIVVLLIGLGPAPAAGQRDLDPDEIAMLHVYLATPYRLELDNQAVLETLQALPGVTKVEGQTIFPAWWQPASAEDFERVAVTAYAGVMSDTQLERPRLLAGRFSQAGMNEIMLDQRLADRYDFEIGDTVVFRSLTTDLAVEEWIITAIVEQPYPTFSPAINPTLLGAGSVYATADDARYLTGSDELTAIFARYESFGVAEARQADFLATIATETPYVPLLSYLADPDEPNPLPARGALDDALDLRTEVVPQVMFVAPTGVDADAMRFLLQNEVDGIVAASPGFVYGAGLDVQYIGFDPATNTLDFELVEGEAWFSDPERAGVVTSQELASTQNKRVGDTITIRVGGSEVEYEIIGIHSGTGQTVYMPWIDLAMLAGFIEENDTPLPNRLFFTLDGDPDAAAVDAIIADMDAVLAENYIRGFFVNLAEE
ncbi:MAG: hypothetical protein GYB65_19400 [Chloroflexi bacterium]|nr:hypothetical protein [Chloroflexota bacterium]